MKKTITLSSLALVLSTIATSSLASGTELLPVLNQGYEADFAIAVLGGQTDFDQASSSSSAKGIEVSFNCPLLKLENNVIRQQISYIKTDSNGVETQSFEANPHRMFKLADNISVGAGPSLGVSTIKTAGQKDSVFTYGLGASARYDLGNQMFLGAEAVYAKSKDVDITGIDDIDNTRVMGKIGFKFY